MNSKSPATALESAMGAVREAPEDTGAWEALEELASENQGQEDVAALYREVLRGTQNPVLVESVGQRAVQWHEEWLGEDSAGLREVLDRVLEIDPSSPWAFQRLTVLHTSKGRWDDLLAVYDRAIAATDDAAQKKTLLDEAANIAKDFAGNTDATIRYMQALLRLNPADKALGTNLEKQLERQGRYGELIQLWHERLGTVSRDERWKLRTRIAECLYAKVNRADEAVQAMREVLAEGAKKDEPLAILERIAADAALAVDTRRTALDLLGARYKADGDDADLVRTLTASLALSEGDGDTGLHREAAERLLATGDAAGAMDHFAAVLRADPGARDVRDKFRAVAERSGEFAKYVEAMDEAAGVAESEGNGPLAASLWSDAGEVCRTKLADLDGAIERYGRVLASATSEPKQRLAVARNLNQIFADAERPEEQLAVLEELAKVEPDPSDRRAAAGTAARIAEGVGDVDRALANWRARVTTDANDAEAIDAIIVILEQQSRWDELVAALRLRAETAPSPALSRADLVRAATVLANEGETPDDAIALWEDIVERFGEDPESVDALATLFTRAERWEDVGQLLVKGAAREAQHIAEVLANAGEVERDRLERPTVAAARFAAALAVAPDHARSQAGLRSLLDDEDAAPVVVEALGDAYRRTDDWKGVIVLSETRVSLAKSAAEKSHVLVEAAKLLETRGGDLDRALGRWGTAWTFAPEDPFIEGEVLRLAKATSRWDLTRSAVEGARDAVPAASPRAHALSLLLAEILATHLDETAESLVVLADVLESLPERRDVLEKVLAAAAGEKDVAKAARGLAIHTARLGTFDGPLFDGAFAQFADVQESKDFARALEAALGEVSLPSRVMLDATLWFARVYENSLLDGAAAERHFDVALGLDGSNETAILGLVRIRRRVPSRKLYDSLLRSFDLAPQNLDPLAEAASLSFSVGVPAEERDLLLTRVYRRAAQMWKEGTAAEGTRDAEGVSRWALDALWEIHHGDKAHRRLVALAAEAVDLPLSAEERLDWRRRAAAAAEAAGDRDRAAVMYRSILDEEPTDRAATAALAALCEKDGRLAEMLTLLKSELSFAPDLPRRLALRLEIARLVGEIERTGGRIEALHENLREAPGHGPTIDVLSTTLESLGRFGELSDALTAQATHLENAGEGTDAARLWSKVATFAETKLGDADRAANAYRHVVELSVTPSALDALARLRADHGDHAAAAQWLERRLVVADATERTHIALRLARAHLAAGQRERAVKCLESAFEENHASPEIRETLADVYRSDGRLDQLAWVLTESAPHVDDRDTLVSHAREASEIFRAQGHPDRAIPVLTRAVEVASDDRELRVMLADGLRAAGRHGEAREILTAVIEEFGRRRNAERAQIHLLLAQVEHAAGDLPAAIAQLELASGMDASNATILRMLGDLALESDDSVRAERAYRALLLIVRRQAASDDVNAIGMAEVQYALHRIAKKRDDDDQARALLDSAYESAGQSDVETERLVRALLRWNEGEAAVRALVNRLPEASPKAKMLALLGKVLWSSLGRTEEALGRYLEALVLEPSDDGLHRQIRVLAVEADGSAKYAAVLRKIAVTVGETDPVAGSELLLRLVRVLEEDEQDLVGAAKTAHEIEALGHHRAEAWMAIARIARAKGDSSGEATALERIISSSDDSVPPPVRTDAMFNLAGLRLKDEDHYDTGVTLLNEALERDPRYTQVGSMLKDVDAPTNTSLMSLYGRVARSSTDASVLLDFLEKRARRSDATMEEVREAVELAESHDGGARFDALLVRAVHVAKESPNGLPAHIWAAEKLAARLIAAGDVQGALRYLRDAAESATSDGGGGDRAFELWISSADLARKSGANDAAKEIYQRLLADHPSERRVWEPYLTLLRELGDEDAFNDLAASVVDGLQDPSARNAVRVERAKYLLSLTEREPDAAEVLRQVLAEEPGHAEAASMLADLFERTGYDEDLVELLGQQLDVAIGERELPAIKDLSLRMGAILARVRRDDALDVYRRALEWLGTDADVARALLDILADDHDPRERAAVMERLLAGTRGPEGAGLALDLVQRWTELDDALGVRRALEFGYDATPESMEIRERLEALYGEQRDFAALASYWVREAARSKDPRHAVVLLRNAAAMHLDELGDPAAAADTLRQAMAIAPNDMSIVSALISARVAAGAFEEASEDVDAALSQPSLTGTDQAEILRARGGLRLAMGNDADAISDLEQAYVLGGTDFGADLAQGLSNAAERAAGAGDDSARRDAVLRLVQVLSETGEGDRAREILHGWVTEFPSDRDAVELLCSIDEAAERWDALMESTLRLVNITEGDDRIAAVLRLSEASARAGRPGDARAAMEETLRQNPGSADLRKQLAVLYERAGAHEELASLLMEDLSHETDEERRHALLRRAGGLYLEAGNSEAGLPVLEEAARMRPNDHGTVILLVDALIADERFAPAGEILEKAIDVHPKRRSPELAELQLRMSVLAEKAGDPNLQMQWLNAAMESDKANGDITARLAHLAIDLKEYEVALNALRVVTLSKTDGPMSRAMAFLLQARIAHERGEERRALLWARKAKSEDPNLTEADDFLARIGAT